MKKIEVLLCLFNIAFYSAESFGQQLTHSSYTNEFNYSNVFLAEDIKFYRFTHRQRLDHFAPKGDNRKWDQRYAVTAHYYNKGGPAFLLLRGANPMDKGCEFSNNVLAYAKNLKAICFAIEHRFYGRTQPINGSLMHHLNTDQILADIAYFIQGMFEEFHLPKHTKWILYGCSYGGMMSAWARLKYPHLIHGAVASSTLLLAKLDYYEYEQIVEESLKSYDSKCVESIKVGFEEVETLAINNETINSIKQMFYLSDEEPNEMSYLKQFIIYTMITIFNNAVQENDSPQNRISMSSVCKIMNEYNGTKFQAFAALNKMDMGHGEDDVEAPVKSQGQNSAQDEYRKIKEAWLYQRCSEFGLFSSYKNTSFLSPVSHLLISVEMEVEILCGQFFGPNFSATNLTEKINRTNSQYGGLEFNVRNTLFVHGSFDPWHRAGLYKKSNASLYEVIFIEGASHCSDTFPPSDRDPPELRKAHSKIFNVLKSWLQENPDTSVSSSN